MSRTSCPRCQRPEPTCICRFTVAITNDIHVVVLQHPSEVKQTKGTVALLTKSLSSCQVIYGENFSDNAELVKVFEQYQPLLLYPGETAKVLGKTFFEQQKQSTVEHEDIATNTSLTTKPFCLVILDGTWKKAYRMFMTSSNLAQIPQVCLPADIASSGQYHIRKVAKKNALSSLEATCYALALLEESHQLFTSSAHLTVSANNAGKYQPLLDKFHDFNHFQLSFRPQEHIDKPRNQNDL